MSMFQSKTLNKIHSFVAPCFVVDHRYPPPSPPPILPISLSKCKVIMIKARFKKGGDTKDR